MLAKLAMVAAGMVTASAASSDTAPAEDARPFVAQLYQRYHHGNILFESSTQIYSEKLARLMARAARLTETEGTLSLDPLCECVEYDVRAVKITLPPPEETTAHATVSFHNFGKPHRVELQLVAVNHQWRVDDVKSHGVSFQQKLHASIDAAQAPQN